MVGVDNSVVIEDVHHGEDAQGEVITIQVRVRKRRRPRCGICQRKAPGYDGGHGPRRWRALDLGTVRAFVQAPAPRVCCPEHGVVVAHLPWARHGAGHTLAFDDQAAWLAVQCSKSAVTALMRIAWRTVGAIITRVGEDALAGVDRFANLRRIGIDEISYKKGHKYLTVVVDHDTRALIWAAPGRDKATLRTFFDALGPQRSAAITHISADAADWVASVVAERCPQAIQCADPFHVVMWATDALDQVRRETWNDARAQACAEPKRARGHPPKDAPPQTMTAHAKALKDSRYALWKNPENLTENQAEKLAWIAKADPRLHRAYLLKEGLRTVFALRGPEAKEALARWICWARRCRIPAFVALQRRIVKHTATINATLDHGLSNGLIESTNTKIRRLTRQAYGFHNPEALIALAMLAVGGYCPPLPGRAKAA